MANELICCGDAIAKSQSKTTGVYTLRCKKCGTIGAASTPKDAEAQFLQNREGASSSALPTQAMALPQYMADHMADMRAVTIPFIAANRPALSRLIKNNIRCSIKKIYSCRRTSSYFFNKNHTTTSTSSHRPCVKYCCSV